MKLTDKFWEEKAKIQVNNINREMDSFIVVCEMNIVLNIIKIREKRKN